MPGLFRSQSYLLNVSVHISGDAGGRVALHGLSAAHAGAGLGADLHHVGDRGSRGVVDINIDRGGVRDGTRASREEQQCAGGENLGKILLVHGK